MRIHSILGTAIVCMAVGFLGGCGDDEGDALGECPPNSTADQDSGRTIVTMSCVSCHGSMVSGSARGGAPATSNLDDAAYVKAEAGEIYERVKDGTMPPGGSGLPAPDQEKVRIWLACGASGL